MPKPKDRWQDLCAQVREDDGLISRLAGAWTYDKLFWWHRYLTITTNALVGNSNFPGGIVYVDLFSGPGVLVDDQGKRYPGSPLLAANTEKPFTRILLCEKVAATADACEARLRRTNAQHSPVFRGDCNDQIDLMCQEIPPRSLTLAFVDPTGLHANFETIQKLTAGRKVDLLILFADEMDIIRNVQTYFAKPGSNLDQILGPQCPWREQFSELDSHANRDLKQFFLGLYQSQLQRHLGYTFFRDTVLYLKANRPLYRVLYATRHELGLKFWDESLKKHRRGEQSLPFD